MQTSIVSTNPKQLFSDFWARTNQIIASSTCTSWVIWSLSVRPFVHLSICNVFSCNPQNACFWLLTSIEQGQIHGIRCSETPFKEKALRTLRTDGWTDRTSYRGSSSHLLYRGISPDPFTHTQHAEPRWQGIQKYTHIQKDAHINTYTHTNARPKLAR